MEESIRVLSGIPEFENSKKDLSRLQERLEGLARPQLLQAFNAYEIGTRSFH